MIVHPSTPPLIEARPGVCGGAACIAGTRIPVWMLYEARLGGLSDKKLLAMHRSLTREQLAAAWAYAERHESELLDRIRLNRDS